MGSIFLQTNFKEPAKEFDACLQISSNSRVYVDID